MRLSPSDMLPVEGRAEIEGGERFTVRFILNSVTPVGLSYVDEDGEVHKMADFPSGLFSRAYVFKRVRSLLFEAPKFSLAYRVWYTQEGEPHDHDAPPPPPRPDNLLAQIREKVRREMGVTREGFLERDVDFPGYERDDDDDDIFEEEEQLAAEMAAEAKKQADAKKQAEADNREVDTDKRSNKKAAAVVSDDGDDEKD